eukprot:scaffold67100_cov51-Attheya_sp.AAC.5
MSSRLSYIRCVGIVQYQYRSNRTNNFERCLWPCTSPHEPPRATDYNISTNVSEEWSEEAQYQFALILIEESPWPPSV